MIPYMQTKMQFLGGLTGLHLANVAQVVGRLPAKWKFASSIPG